MMQFSPVDLKPGDILVPAADGAAAPARRAMLYVGRATVVGSARAGVYAQCLRSVCATAAPVAVLRAPTAQREQLRQISEDALTQVGRRYADLRELSETLHYSLPGDAQYQALLVAQTYRNRKMPLTAQPSYCDADAILQSPVLRRLGQFDQTAMNGRHTWCAEEEGVTVLRLYAGVRAATGVVVTSVADILELVRRQPEHDKPIAALLQSSGVLLSPEWGMQHAPHWYHVDAFVHAIKVVRRRQVAESLFAMETANMQALRRHLKALTDQQYTRPTDSVCLLIALQRRRIDLANRRLAVIDNVMALSPAIPPGATAINHHDA